MAFAGDHIKVKINTTDLPAGVITSVDLPLTYAQHDVTGFGDTAQRFINGQLQSTVTLKGFMTLGANGTHTLLNAAFAAGNSIDLEVQVGQNATPTTGDPKYTGKFFIESYKPMLDKGSAVTFEAILKPAVGTGTGVPAWGVI